MTCAYSFPCSVTTTTPQWLPTTKDATEAEARDTMALFAAETEKRKPWFLIVDTTEFFHRWADDMMAWRD